MTSCLWRLAELDKTLILGPFSPPPGYCWISSKNWSQIRWCKEGLGCYLWWVCLCFISGDDFLESCCTLRLLEINRIKSYVWFSIIKMSFCCSEFKYKDCIGGSQFILILPRSWLCSLEFHVGKPMKFHLFMEDFITTF